MGAYLESFHNKCLLFGSDAQPISPYCAYESCNVKLYMFGKIRAIYGHIEIIMRDYTLGFLCAYVQRRMTIKDAEGIE